MKIRKISVKLITYLTLFVLVLIMAVGSAFSWYDRTNNNEPKAVKLNYSLAGSRVNYLGGYDLDTKIGTYNVNNGIVEYNDDMSTIVGTAISIPKNTVQYFKTTIHGHKQQLDAGLVSLCIDKIEGNNLYLGVCSPEKIREKNVSGKNICISDYLYVPAYGSSKGDTLEVIWYIGSDTDTTVTLGTPYLRYN